eukprot:TRINITY_DN112047_c0_g1_i1.p1 TRINITY_DN112047_c0_g1~~TRINITY_DN112047_c0_g1_i1.p1  ORF type:complete len:114 (+),score=4.16 TRINITY_DN112047_c0_g1_i1:54-344(+)
MDDGDELRSRPSEASQEVCTRKPAPICDSLPRDRVAPLSGGGASVTNIFVGIMLVLVSSGLGATTNACLNCLAFLLLLFCTFYPTYSLRWSPNIVK